MKTHQQGMLSGVMGGLLCVGGIAHAQDTQQGRGSVLEEIVVTAEKRAQSLQDVPVAVSAYTSVRRDLLGVNTIEDVARITPSLSYTNNDRLSIRGFGRLTNNIGTDPSVALYSDGIFSTSMADTSTPSLFIDRTEILRGPQGTLYGRNSIGGTLNVIAKRPTKELKGEVRGRIGNYDSWRTDALLRGPITDSLRFLVGGYKERRDEGFINNVGPGDDTANSDRWMVEAQLEADLGERVVARVRYSKFEWLDSYGVGNTLETNVSPFNNVSLTGTGTSALYYNTVFGYAGENPGVTDPYSINTNYGAIGTLKDHHRIHLDVTADFERRDAETAFRLSAVRVFHIIGQRQHAAHRPVQYSGSGGRHLVGRSRWAGGPAAEPEHHSADVHRLRRFARRAHVLSRAPAVAIERAQSLFERRRRTAMDRRLVSIQPEVGPAAGHPRCRRSSAVESGRGCARIRVARSWPWTVTWRRTRTPGSARSIGRLPTKWTFTLGLRYTKIKRPASTSLVTWRAFRQQRSVRPIRRRRWRTRSSVCFPRDAAFVHPNSSADTRAVGCLGGARANAGTRAGCDADRQVCGALPCASDLLPNPGGGLRRNLEGDWDAVTGTTGLQWEPNDDTNLYLRYSRGYKSGGWLGSNGLTANPYADPEYVDSYEIGVKTVFAASAASEYGGVLQRLRWFPDATHRLARHDHRGSFPQLAGTGARRGGRGDVVAAGSFAIDGELCLSRCGDHRRLLFRRQRGS